MKKNILFLLIFCLSLATTAQPPQLIPYQAIARDNAGNPVLNQNIGLRFSIHDQTISGTVVWQESQTVVSNNLGIIVTALGGTTQLTSVDWGSGAKFLQVEMDISGGMNYLDMGTQQMMSVPYALYAETSGSVINNGGGGNGSFTHWIGELYGGGIICYLWKDAQGVEHGLIASLIDLAYNSNTFLDGLKWYESQYPPIDGQTFLGAYASSPYDGQQASAELSGQMFFNNPNPASVCENYSNEGFNDWYLPSIDELIHFWNNHYALNQVLLSQIGANAIGLFSNSSQNQYWSSTITGGGTFFAMNCQINTYGSGIGSLNVVPYGQYGNYPNNVRAIRKF